MRRSKLDVLMDILIYFTAFLLVGLSCTVMVLSVYVLIH